MTKHIVGFSGGVDSQACALWVRRRFDPADVILLNSDPGGHEHPTTYGFIDEVVAWSRTVRGGVQLALPLVEEAAARGECSSRYGLCE